MVLLLARYLAGLLIHYLRDVKGELVSKVASMISPSSLNGLLLTYGEHLINVSCKHIANVSF